jgi:hypothetical protein
MDLNNLYANVVVYVVVTVFMYFNIGMVLWFHKLPDVCYVRNCWNAYIFYTCFCIHEYKIYIYK